MDYCAEALSRFQQNPFILILNVSLSLQCRTKWLGTGVRLDDDLGITVCISDHNEDQHNKWKIQKGGSLGMHQYTLLYFPFFQRCQLSFLSHLQAKGLYSGITQYTGVNHGRNCNTAWQEKPWALYTPFPAPAFRPTGPSVSVKSCWKAISSISLNQRSITQLYTWHLYSLQQAPIKISKSQIKTDLFS